MIAVRSIRVSCFIALFGAAACGGAVTPRPDAPMSAKPSTEPSAAEKRAAADELYRMGREQMRNGDTLRAGEYFASALENGGSADKIMPDLMRASIVGRRYQAAIRCFEDNRSQMSQAGRVKFDVIVGVLYLGLDQPERARDAFEASLAIDPNNARAHFLLAELLRENFGDYGASESHYREYLKLEPDGEHAVVARAGILKDPHDELKRGKKSGPRFQPVPQRKAR